MKIIFKALILTLFISFLFASQVMAADSWDDWCKPELQEGVCKAQKVNRWWPPQNWPTPFFGKTCDGESFQEVPADWCSNGVTLEEVYTTDKNGDKRSYFNPGETVIIVTHIKNTTGKSVSLSYLYQIFEPDNNAKSLDPVRSNESQINIFTRQEFALPKNAKEGTYKFKGSIIYKDGVLKREEGEFQVGQGTPQAPEEPAGEVTLEKVYAADVYNREINTFKVGETIKLGMDFKNTGKPVDQIYNYSVLDLSNNFVFGGLSRLELSNGGNTSYKSIDSKLEPGEYKVVVRIEYNGKPQEKETKTFTVKAAEADKAGTDKSGQGIVITEVITTNHEREPKSVFNPGDILGIQGFYKNPAGEKIVLMLNFQVFKGTEKVSGFDKPYELTNNGEKEGATANGLEIPDTMEAGNYTVKLLIKYKDSGQEKEVRSDAVAFKVEKAAGAPAAGAPGDKKTQVVTTTQAYIHGVKEGTFDYRDLTENWISVGSLTWADSEQSECLKGSGPNSVELNFSKITGNKEQNIPVSNVPVDVGNALGAAHPNHKTCWSYQAKLLAGMKKQGKYKLTAKFAGNDYYKASENTVYVNFANKGSKVGTTVEVVLQGVEGVAVKKEGDQIKLIKEGGSQEVMIFTPRAYAIGRVCNQDEIPLVHLTVVMVNKDGTTEIIYDNPTYPNCEPYTLYVDELGDLNEINRIEASAILPEDPESEYASSQGEMIIKVSEEVSQVAEAETYVHLGSNPLENNIKSGDNVWVFATTNKAVQNPLFKVIRNGEEYIMAANSSNNACQFKATTCNYSFIIFQVDGDYEISFENDGASDSLSFNTQTKPVGQIASVGLLINGEEIPLSMEGGLINLHLDGSPTNSFLIVIHYIDGTELRKSLVFEYSPETSPPTLQEGDPSASGDDESGLRCEEVHIRNECVDCNESQKVYQQYCYGDIISGDPYAGERQYDSACSSWCSGGGSSGNTCAYTESFNCTGQNGGCGSGSGEMRKTIINTDCSESSVSYCDGACAPSGGECDDLYYCDENVGRIIHKYGYWDNGCQYAYDQEEPC